MSFTDSEGLTHSVEVSAGTLFEACTLAVVEFRRSALVNCQPGAAARFSVHVKAPATTHEVSMGKLERWLASGGKSPNEQVEKQRFESFSTSNRAGPTRALLPIMRSSWPVRCLFCFILALGFDSGTALAEHTIRYCSSCERDAHGRIKRSTSVRRAFQREHPCPSTGQQTGSRPGYIKDHIRALKHGGTDTVNNMQWEATTEARTKDRIE